MIVAARSPRPETSPITKRSLPPSSSRTSYQSPPMSTPSTPATYRTRELEARDLRERFGQEAVLQRRRDRALVGQQPGVLGRGRLELPGQALGVLAPPGQALDEHRRGDGDEEPERGERPRQLEEQRAPQLHAWHEHDQDLLVAEGHCDRAAPPDRDAAARAGSRAGCAGSDALRGTGRSRSPRTRSSSRCAPCGRAAASPRCRPRTACPIPAPRLRSRVDGRARRAGSRPTAWTSCVACSMTDRMRAGLCCASFGGSPTTSSSCGHRIPRPRARPRRRESPVAVSGPASCLKDARSPFVVSARPPPRRASPAVPADRGRRDGRGFVDPLVQETILVVVAQQPRADRDRRGEEQADDEDDDRADVQRPARPSCPGAHCCVGRCSSAGEGGETETVADLGPAQRRDGLGGLAARRQAREQLLGDVGDLHCSGIHRGREGEVRAGDPGDLADELRRRQLRSLRAWLRARDRGAQ